MTIIGSGLPQQPIQSSSLPALTATAAASTAAQSASQEASEWTVVNRKKWIESEEPKIIYYWAVDSHNLFDRRNKHCKLFFLEPDVTQIELMDQTDYMAIDEAGQLRRLHSQLKHNGMKMNPAFFIARTVKQITGHSVASSTVWLRSTTMNRNWSKASRRYKPPIRCPTCPPVPPCPVSLVDQVSWLSNLKLNLSTDIYRSFFG